MKTVQIVKPSELRLIDTEKPVITGKDNVLVKMTAAGICGSDVGIYHGTNAATTCPRIVGHEMAGRAGEVGPGIANLKVGGRVIINQATSCGCCYPCKTGRGNVYDSLAIRDVHIDGGYRKCIAVPESDYYISPESLSDQDVVMIEPTTIGTQSCIRTDFEKDDLLLTYGSDILGSSILEIARLLYDHIIVAGMAGDKLEIAKANRATHTINVLKENLIEKVKGYTYDHGAIVSIDAVCNKDSLIDLLQATSNTGRVMTMGLSIAPIEINQFLVTSKEPDVRDFGLQNKMFGKAIELVNEGKLDLANSISHTFPLAKAQEAFGFMDSHDPSIHKIVLIFDF